ncbi:MAG: tetratricopeptide repeat protein [Candidatus Eisenbacteria bacterium]
MTRRALALVLLLCVAPPAHATDLAAFAAARDSLERGVNLGRADLVLGARGAFESLAAAEPDSVVLEYWVAVCDWRATPLAMRGANPKVPRSICEHGLAVTGRVLAKNPRDAATLALEAGLLGLSLSFQDASAAMTVGPRMIALYARARALAPDDPRVAFLDALNTLHMPEFYGGGARKALPRFEEAIARFDHDTAAGPLAPVWGRDDALLWAGQCAQRLGDVEAARVYYRRALEANPDNGRLRHELLPALDAPPAGTQKKDGR